MSSDAIGEIRWSPRDGGEVNPDDLTGLRLTTRYTDTGDIMNEGLAIPYELFASDEFVLNQGSYGEMYGFITFITHPCMQIAGDASSPDTCEAVCTNPELLFGSWTTLWTCLTLASVSLGVETFDHVRENYGPNITSFLDFLSAPGVNLTAIDGTAVIDITYRCALASCLQNSIGDCNTDFQGPAEKFIEGESNDWSFLNEEYCSSVDGTINVDVAGPGVIVSYLLQSFFALYAWAAIMILSLESNTRVLAKPYLYTMGKMLKRKLTLVDAHPSAARLFHRLEDSNFTHATASFITDFHEAQCFFIFATSFALIYAQRQPANFNGADSWESLLLNRVFIARLVQSGALPLLLTQLTLHRLSISSVYSLVCSTLALIMAGVTATQLTKYHVDRVHDMFKNESGLEECGGHPSLRIFCLERSHLDEAEIDPESIFLWLILLLVLWCFHIRSFLAEFAASLLGKMFGGRKMTRARTMPLRDMFSTSRRATAGEWAESFYSLMAAPPWLLGLCIDMGILATHGFIVYTMIENLGELVKSLVEVLHSDGDWNVGQVIAVLLWVPVLAKYLYTILFGMERGFAIRLSNAFTIRRKEQVTASNKDNEEDEGETMQLQPSPALPAMTWSHQSSLQITDASDVDLSDGIGLRREAV